MNNKDNHLKIAILSVHSSPLGRPGAKDTGGMSVYVRELTRELARQGHSIDIYTRSQDSTLPEVVPLVQGDRLIHVQSGKPVDLDKLLIYSHAPDVACKIENFRKRNNLKYDIIFSHYWISGISGLYLKTWWQIPHLVMFHTLGAAKNAIGIGEDEPELRIQEEALIGRECDRVIASTMRGQYFLNEKYQVPLEKIKVIPCGVNMETFQPMDKLKARKELGLRDGKIILFVGRIERLKGINRLIQAMPYLKDHRPTLLIAGEDGNRQGEINNLKILAAELAVADSVFFPGLIDYSRLPFYYNAADVCVLPSYYESFGLVPLESLACGTPVITTDVGDLRNIIHEGETGFILLDDLPQHLADKLSMLLSGSAPKLASRSMIRDSVSRYGWQHIAISIIKEFEKILVIDKGKA
jgi:D-inositol-3-phosphate glycosyltransferase